MSRWGYALFFAIATGGVAAGITGVVAEGFGDGTRGAASALVGVAAATLVGVAVYRSDKGG